MSAGPLRRTSPPLLLVALALLAVAPALVGDRAFIGGDLLLYFYPFRETLADSLGAGQLWAWDPSTGCGAPFCADPQAICFDPAAPLYALFSLHRALALEVALRLALAGVGTWVFLRGRRVPDGPALLFAAPVALGGVAVSLIGRTDKLGAFAMLPWVFAAVDAGIARVWWGWPALVLSLAVGAASGGLEVWAMAVGAALVWAVATPAPDEEAPRSVSARAADGARAAACLLASTVLMAVVWLPFRAAMASSSRGGGLTFEAATEVSAHPARLLGLALPELFYDPDALLGRLHPGTSPQLFYVLAISAGWLTLGLAARGLQRSAPARLLGALLALSALLALGRYLPGYRLLYEHVPGMALWRYPEKLLIPLGFALPAMAGLGAAHGLSPRLTRALAMIGLAGAVLGLGLGGLGAGWVASLGVALLGGAEADWGAWAGRVGVGLVVHGVALLAGALLVERGRWRLALVPLVADLLFVHAGVNPLGSADLTRPGQAASALAPETRVEAFSAAMGASLMPVQAAGLEERLTAFRAGLYPDMGVLDGLWHTDSVRAIRPMPTARLFGAVEGSDAATYLRFLELAGTGAVVATRPAEEQSLADWPGARRLGGVAGTPISLWALDGAAPQVYRTGRARALPSAGATVRAMKSGEVDPRAAVSLVTEEVIPAPPAGQGWADGEVRVLQRAPGLLDVETSGEQAGWLVFLETDDPGWSATVDGAPSPVRRAQSAFMAVAVPAGRAEVSLRYVAPGRSLGLVLSGLGAVALAIWTAGARRRV